MNVLNNLFAQAQNGPMVTIEGGMTAASWAFMITVWAIILIMTSWCFWKLMSKEHLMEKHLFEPDPEDESLAAGNGEGDSNT